MSGDEALNEDGTEDVFSDTERRYNESIDRLTEEHLRVVDAYAESLHRIADLEKAQKAANHGQDCNYWQWDWRYSWDETDCICAQVGSTGGEDMSVCGRSNCVDGLVPSEEGASLANCGYCKIIRVESANKQLKAENKKLRTFVAAYDAYREAMDSDDFIRQASAATAIRSARDDLDRER